MVGVGGNDNFIFGPTTKGLLVSSHGRCTLCRDAVPAGQGGKGGWYLP
jgi:hypothetical protein